MKETAIYIHIPFCDHKCIYCDFYSIIKYDDKDSYLKALKKEIKHYSNLYGKDRLISTIFFGGGTPSFMSPDYITEIVDSVRNNFNLSNSAEITLETNPGTVNKNKLIDFRAVGINRISIGIQSFDNEELKFLTRIHDEHTAIETVKAANQAGFENISIDLIFNLPKQSKELWKKNLEKAVNLPIQHISAYSLILEKGTILNKMVLDGKVKMQDIEHDAELYDLTIEYLSKAGFNQYEVSNFAKNNFECAHNNIYWHYKDYLSFGTSAHSFVDGKRWWNFKALSQYLRAVKANNSAVAGSEVLSSKEMMDEYIMLALRSRGILVQEFIAKFGEVWLSQKKDYFSKLQSKGYLHIDNNIIKLTRRGYALCDQLVLDLIT